jgi:hypothetical protein
MLRRLIFSALLIIILLALSGQLGSQAPRRDRTGPTFNSSLSGSK